MGSSWVSVEVTTADIPGLIRILTDGGIVLRNVRQLDALTVYFELLRSEQAVISKLVSKSGGSLRVTSRGKSAGKLSWMRRRLVLIFGLTLLAAVTVYLPTRILFVQVEGNVLLPRKQILEYAAKCGIELGVRTRSIRSEQVKNRLLEEMPQLQWVGVNSSGCVAVIAVKERSQEENMQPEPAVSSMVAVRDGIIQSCTATKGSLVCSPGQAVKAGQVLISGYTDCGLTIRAGRSEGEVYAQTLHKLCVKVPLNWIQKGETIRVEEKYSLIIGKKRINFYKDSGILGTGCDKMYTEYVLTLPGGFQLPISFVVERWVYCEDQKVGSQEQDMNMVASNTAQSYLRNQMLGGQILRSTCSRSSEQGILTLQGEYRCVEMIGRIRGEEIIQYHGKDN